MKRIKHMLLAVCAATLALTSCSSDDDGMQVPVPDGDYLTGIFVLNEGNSNPATATITFIEDDGGATADIFRKANPGADETGSYLQHMFFDDSRAFIVSGQANSITVVDRYTFKLDTTLSGAFKSPRYGAVVGDHAFVTNSADFSTGDDDFLTVIDLKDYSTQKVDLNDWSEKVLSLEGKLYIANGYYGGGNSISVLNPATSTVEKVIDLGTGNSPNSFEAKDGTLYVLTSDSEGAGKIFTIDVTTASVTHSLAVPKAIVRPGNLQIEGSRIYFTSGKSVYSMEQGAATFPEKPLINLASDVDFTAIYGFNMIKNVIYIADSGDYASDSKVYQYSLEGNLQKTFPVGVGPNSFYSNY